MSSRNRINIRKLARAADAADKITKREARNRRSRDDGETLMHETALGHFEQLSMAERYEANIGHTLAGVFAEIGQAVAGKKRRSR